MTDDIDTDSTTEDTSPLELLKNGRIRVWFNDDESYTLRRPKFGEFRQVKGWLFAAQRKIKDRADEFNAKLNDAADEEKADLAELLLEETLDYSYDELARFHTEVQRLLGDREPLDSDDLPAWLIADQTVAQRMVEHWKTVPLGRG